MIVTSNGRMPNRTQMFEQGGRMATVKCKRTEYGYKVTFELVENGEHQFGDSLLTHSLNSALTQYGESVIQATDWVQSTDDYQAGS